MGNIWLDDRNYGILELLDRDSPRDSKDIGLLLNMDTQETQLRLQTLYEMSCIRRVRYGRSS